MMKILFKIFIIILILCGFSGAQVYGAESDKSGAVENSQQHPALQEPVKPPFSQKGNFEIGGVVGMPSGLNFRYWIVDFFGFDFTLGSTLKRDFLLTFDFLFEHINLYTSNDLNLRLFYGVGGLVGYHEKKFYANVRAPLGLSLPFRNYPVTLSFYGAPALIVTQKWKFDVNWGIAVRFNFGQAARIRAREVSLRGKLDLAEDGYGRIKSKLDTTRDELTGIQSELNSTKNKLGSAMNELKDAKGNLSRARNELDGTKAELYNAKNNLDSTVSDLENTKQRLLSAKDQLDGIKKELDSTKTELDVTRDLLTKAKKKLDARETELLDKQKELDTARTIIKDKLSGREREIEQQKVDRNQAKLNKEIQDLKKQKEAWEKEHEKHKKKREQQKTACEARRGIINEDGYCDCRPHEQWNYDRSACVCVKGYVLNSRTDRCEPCELVNVFGVCTGACGADEKRVYSGRGPHKYVCVKKCTRPNEIWSDRKNACVCRDGYFREANGECSPRR